MLVVGLSVFLYRHWILDVPLSESENVNSWTIEASLRFAAQKNVPVKASFNIPYIPPHFAILDEYFISHKYSVSTGLSGYNRHAVWTVRRSMGPQSLYYRAIFREIDSADSYLPKPHSLKLTHLDENQNAAVNIIIEQARQSSADIQTFAQSSIKELNKNDGNTKLLVGNLFDDEHITKAVVTILNHAKIHAVPVIGISLNKKQKADFKYLVLVYNDKEWIYLNPRTGASGLPDNFLIWQYGFDPLFEVIGGKHVQFNLSVSPTPINALSAAKLRGLQIESQLLRFSLLQLPLNVQETYKILLTVPIGAFIILILRNFIGLSTFGTFMPVLIALAFRETKVIWGLTLFTIIVSLGLLARFYLEQLRLLLVPRLASILTIVIFLMIFISIVSQNLGLESGLSVALFPMVILTMTIERMCITWDELGAYQAIKGGAGSLLAAVVAYSAMNKASLQYLMFAFPELLLVLLAIILWFGQYRGYRLLELFRFSSLARAKSC